MEKSYEIWYNVIIGGEEMETNKTIVIYTKENNKYHAFITGMNVFVSAYNTLEECEASVAEDIRDKSETSTLESTAKEMKRYFNEADTETIENIIKIDIVEC